MKPVTLAGADGAPAFSYVEDQRYGLPCADLVEVVGPGAVGAIMANLPGWAVAGPVDLGEALVARGADVPGPAVRTAEKWRARCGGRRVASPRFLGGVSKWGTSRSVI
nr:hypothetical protein [Microbispora rosea]